MCVLRPSPRGDRAVVQRAGLRYTRRFEGLSSDHVHHNLLPGCHRGLVYRRRQQVRAVGRASGAPSRRRRRRRWRPMVRKRGGWVRRGPVLVCRRLRRVLGVKRLWPPTQGLSLVFLCLLCLHAHNALQAQGQNTYSVVVRVNGGAPPRTVSTTVCDDHERPLWSEVTPFAEGQATVVSVPHMSEGRYVRVHAEGFVDAFLSWSQLRFGASLEAVATLE